MRSAYQVCFHSWWTTSRMVRFFGWERLIIIICVFISLRFLCELGVFFFYFCCHYLHICSFVFTFIRICSAFIYLTIYSEIKQQTGTSAWTRIAPDNSSQFFAQFNVVFYIFDRDTVVFVVLWQVSGLHGVWIQYHIECQVKHYASCERTGILAAEILHFKSSSSSNMFGTRYR